MIDLQRIKALGALCLVRDHTTYAVTHDEKIYDRLDRIYKLRDGQMVETEERAAA